MKPNTEANKKKKKTQSYKLEQSLLGKLKCHIHLRDVYVCMCAEVHLCMHCVLYMCVCPSKCIEKNRSGCPFEKIK